MKNYFLSSYLQPFFQFFDQQKIDITQSDKYIPGYQTAKQNHDLYLPLKNTAEWIQELENNSDYDCISYQVGKKLGRGFIPAEVLNKIHQKQCIVGNYHRLLKFIETTHSNLFAGIYRQTDLKYKFTLSKECFADKSCCWRPIELMHIWILVHFFQHYFGKNWYPKEIGFCSYGSLPKELPNDFKNTKVTLGNNEVYIVVDYRDFITTTNITTKPEIEINHRREHIIDNIKDVIRPILSSTKISVETVAQLLDTSPRSLQRELRLEGYNFRKILSEYRVEVALEYLINSDFSVTEIAQLVGYEKATNFTRAFKKRYHTAPNRIKPQKHKILTNIVHSPSYQNH